MLDINSAVCSNEENKEGLSLLASRPFRAKVLLTDVVLRQTTRRFAEDR